MSESTEKKDTDRCEPQEIALALFDVLGFSERVRQIGLEAIHKHYEELIKLVQSKAGGRVILSAVPAGNGGLVPATGFFLVESTYFSDTIMLWGKYNLATSLPFYDLCIDFICAALELDLPVRGCISFGEAIMNRKRGIFLGEPIIEAARGESSQAWVGVSFGPSLDTPRYSWLGDLKMVMPFTEHIKTGKEAFVEQLVLDWPRRWRDKYRTDPEQQLNKLNTDQRYSTYYETACRFAKFSVENPEWWKSYDFDTRTFR